MRDAGRRVGAVPASIARQFAAWTTGLLAGALAWWSHDAIADNPQTTYGGAHPVLLWFEVAAAAGLMVSGALVISSGSTVAGGLLAMSGPVWLAPELSGVAAQMPIERSVAAMIGWLVLPSIASSLVLLHHRPVDVPGLRYIAVGMSFAALTLIAITQIDPFLDPGCWHTCAHDLAAVPALARWQAGFRWVATAQVCVAGIVAFGLVARPAAWSAGAIEQDNRHGRRRVTTLLVVAAAVLGSLVVAAIMRQVSTERADSAAFLTVTMSAQLGAFALSVRLGWDAMRQLSLRQAVRRLVDNLETMRTPHDLAAALSRVLADTGLQVAYWLPAKSAWVDSAGEVLAEWSTTSGRAVTTIVRDGAPVARIVHSDGVDRKYLDAALGPALKLAIENARLQAASLVELADLRASRQRIIERSDSERLSLERNLHDGAQQRVVSLALIFGMMRAQLEHTNPSAAAVIRRAADISDALLNELRAIGRGIYPPTLTGAGLVAAVNDLAETQDDVIVGVDAPDDIRFPPNVEAATYIIIDSAVRDAAQRNASTVAVVVSLQPGRLVVDVRDDGRPTAEHATVPFADRIGVLNGAVTLSSRDDTDDHGASVHLEVPCG